MSAVRCREGRLGKFTRPKGTWGKRRRAEAARLEARSRALPLAQASAVNSIAQTMMSKAGMGFLRQKRG